MAKPRLVFVAVTLFACSNDQPPLIGDSDGSPQFVDAYTPPRPDDAAADGGSAFDLDFAGACAQGALSVWHFFDFQTHTPGTSSLQFLARTANTEALLDQATSVNLAVVTGPDITVWTGVDVASALQSAGQQSHLFLRIIVIAVPSTDGTPPALVNYRQAYDCIAQ